MIGYSFCLCYFGQKISKNRISIVVVLKATSKRNVKSCYQATSDDFTYGLSFGFDDDFSLPTKNQQISLAV
jgi:hypothetical protein